MVENLTPQLGEFFGAKNGNGVLVRSVEKGSRADKAGLRAGDVITRVGNQPVHDTSDFTHALRDRNAGSVSVGVIRDRKEQTLTLTLPERKDSGMVIEESFEAPEFDAESQTEFSEVQKPNRETSAGDGTSPRTNSQSTAELRESLCSQREQLREQAEKMRQEFTPQLREELEKSRQKLQQEMERLRHQLQGDWLDI